MFYTKSWLCLFTLYRSRQDKVDYKCQFSFKKNCNLLCTAISNIVNDAFRSVSSPFRVWKFTLFLCEIQCCFEVFVLILIFIPDRVYLGLNIKTWFVNLNCKLLKFPLIWILNCVEINFVDFESPTKGQLISKVNWRAITYPKKRT